MCGEADMRAYESEAALVMQVFVSIRKKHSKDFLHVCI